MMPTQTWYAAAATEARLPHRDRPRGLDGAVPKLRRTLGLRLVALGHALAGDRGRLPRPSTTVTR